MDVNERCDPFSVGAIPRRLRSHPRDAGPALDGWNEIPVFGTGTAPRRYRFQGQTLSILFSHRDLRDRQRSPNGNSLDHLVPGEEVISTHDPGFAERHSRMADPEIETP